MHNVFRHRKRGVFKQKLVKDESINTNSIYIVYVELYIFRCYTNKLKYFQLVRVTLKSFLKYYVFL